MKNICLIALMGLLALGFAQVTRADGVGDPLHGYCSVGCIDNGTNSPTGQNPITGFGFTVSPGPATGSTLLLDILVPNNEQGGVTSFGITGTFSGTAALMGGEWTSGDLDTFLGISASPANPIGAFLPSTQALDPTATGFSVYQLDISGPLTLQGASNPNVDPLENLTSGIPTGSYIVGFFNEGDFATVPDWIATANSGAIFETGSVSAPEPATFSLLGAGLLGLVGIARRRLQKS